MTELPICEYTIEGNPEGPTLVFIHGWPDDAQLWHRQIDVLGQQYRCVLITLPNFGVSSVKPGGFSFPDLVEILAKTINAVHPQGPVTLITHDWGAYIGYLVEQAHPQLVRSMISMDIGGHLGQSSLRKSLLVIAYQWPLIAFWVLGGIIPPLGNALSRALGRLVRVPETRRPSIRSRFNYPYFYLWRGMLLPWQRQSILGKYTPQCPVLYLYGTRKPFMFHSDRWLELVTASGGRSAAFDGGHWFMQSCPEPVNRELLQWLEQI